MPCEVCKNRSIVEIQYCMECGENAFGQNLYEPKPTFRTKTCGECAWFRYNEPKYESGLCRKILMTEAQIGACCPVSTHACPAFVAKEEG